MKTVDKSNVLPISIYDKVEFIDVFRERDSVKRRDQENAPIHHHPPLSGVFLALYARETCRG